MKDTDKDGLFTDGTDDLTPKITGIPLSDVDSQEAGQNSISFLLKDASSQISRLVRTEIELAKAEAVQSAKKGGIGGGLLAVAGIIALYSSFFFFFTLAEILDAVGLPRWAAFGIVFLLMLVLAGVLAFAGIKFIKQVKKPEATIESMGQIKEVIPSGKGGDDASGAVRRKQTHDGLYS